MLQWVRRSWILNTSSGLRINTIDKVAATKYCCRAATVWGVPDGSASLDVHAESDETDVLGFSGPPHEDTNAERNAESAAAQAAIDIIRGEAEDVDGVTHSDTAAFR